MVAVVLPSLKFAPPARATVTALARAHAGSAAPAARSGALATLTATRGSTAHASNKKPETASIATGNNARLIMIHTLPTPFPGQPVRRPGRSPYRRIRSLLLR